jgi:hypothetical protein
MILFDFEVIRDAHPGSPLHPAIQTNVKVVIEDGTEEVDQFLRLELEDFLRDWYKGARVETIEQTNRPVVVVDQERYLRQEHLLKKAYDALMVLELTKTPGHMEEIEKTDPKLAEQIREAIKKIDAHKSEVSKNPGS